MHRVRFFVCTWTGLGGGLKVLQLVQAERVKSQPLAEHYTNQYELVSERFDFHPWKQEEWEQRANWLRDSKEDRLNRGELVKLLSAYNEETGNTHVSVKRSLELLEHEETSVIVGGQQAGLFTGPLLVIHKAVTIIRMAQEASRKLGKPVVPVFWIAGEDHDFDEVNHWYALTGQLQVERYRLEHPTGLREAVSRLQFESWSEALSKMEEWLPQSEFKAELMERLTEFAESSRTLSVFFARIMGWLFGSHGLIMMDSDDKRLRTLEGPMFEKMLDQSAAINQSVLNGVAAVERLGYKPQADQTEGNANLFFYDGRGERMLLQMEGSGYTDRKKSFYIEEADLQKLIREEPHRFSNNVMTRPVMQDYVLPVLGVVLGPGEIAYWAMTKEVFHVLGFKMPVILPRLEFTFIEGTIHKNMEKFKLSYDDVMDRFEELRAEWLLDQGQYEVEELFSETHRRFLELYRPVMETVASLNPGLAKLGETNRQKIVEQIEYLRNRASDSLESKFSSGLRQLERIRLGLCPLSKPQERVYNVFAYLNKYGVGWVEELIAQPYENDGKHRLVYF
jgi:bacillithiol synthase